MPRISANKTKNIIKKNNKKILSDSGSESDCDSVELNKLDKSDESTKTTEFDNSSESENSEQKNTQSVQKKRGRPKKQIIQRAIQTAQKSLSTDKNHMKDDEDDLILRIPIFDDGNCENNKSSEKNIFTMKDETDTKSNFLKIDSLTCSEDDISEKKSNDSEKLNNVKELLLELKRKDTLIKKLRNQIGERQDNNSDDDMGPVCFNNIKKNLIDLNLIIINEKNSLIVCEKTNIACWWCSYNFDTIPCFIPDRYVNDKFYVFGCFCTYNCAMAYNLNMADRKVPLRNSLIKELFTRIYKSTEQIYPAPQKELLQKFGGPLKIEEFRDNKFLCKKEYKIHLPPLIPLLPSVEEIYRDPAENPKNIYKKISKK